MPASGLPASALATWAAIVLLVSWASAPGAGAQPSDEPAPRAFQTYVRTISVEKLKERMARADLPIFDVRSQAEYAVSRLPSASRLEATTSPGEFIARHRQNMDGGTIVLYCTIGVRSQDFADGLSIELPYEMITEILVLDGGIIAWHNAGMPLVDDNGPTRRIHVHHADLMDFLDDKSLARHE